MELRLLLAVRRNHLFLSIGAASPRSVPDFSPAVHTLIVSMTYLYIQEADDLLPVLPFI
jgi:hypothetical protein